VKENTPQRKNRLEI